MVAQKVRTRRFVYYKPMYQRHEIVRKVVKSLKQAA